MSEPKTYHRSNAELRQEMVEGVRLVQDLAAWSGLPKAPEHWWVRSLRQRVDRYCGTAEHGPPAMQ